MLDVDADSASCEALQPVAGMCQQFFKGERCLSAVWPADDAVHTHLSNNPNCYKNQCSKVEDFVKLKQNIIEHFLHRNYPIKTIKDSIQKAITQYPRDTTNDTNHKVYPFIITYDCRRPKLNAALTKYLPDLEKDCNTMYISRNKPIIAYSNLKNLGQLITRLDEDNVKQKVIHTNVPLHLPQLITKCGQRGCKTCPGLHQNNVFKATTSKKRIPIRSRLNCHSTNLINVLQCPICKMQYVGQTRGTLQQRMTHHRNKFNDKTSVPRRLLYKHFNQHLGNFYPHIIPVMTTAPTNILTIEQQWITELGTLHPQGLNDIWQ